MNKSWIRFDAGDRRGSGRPAALAPAPGNAACVAEINIGNRLQP